jgi:hypothetical protein
LVFGFGEQRHRGALSRARRRRDRFEKES